MCVHGLGLSYYIIIVGHWSLLFASLLFIVCCALIVNSCQLLCIEFTSIILQHHLAGGGGRDRHVAGSLSRRHYVAHRARGWGGLVLFAHYLIAGPLSLNRAETVALTQTDRGEMLSCFASANSGEVVVLPASCRLVAFALPQNQDEVITSSARRSVSVAPLLSQGKQL